MKTIKVGNAHIKIYEGQSGGYPLFTVVHHENGNRIRENFRDERKASARAHEVAMRIERGTRDVLKLTSADKENYLAAMKALEPLGLPLAAAVQDYVRLKSKTTITPKRVSEIVEELLARKTADGASKRYLELLQSHLRRFARAFQTNIAGVTTALISQWLDSLKIGAVSRNNARRSVVGLFHFARSRGYLTKGQSTEADDVEVARDKGGKISVMKPQDLSKLLSKAKPLQRLYISLAAFTGIRSAELLRLDWKDINFTSGHIEVSAAKSKTRARRLVPIQPNLMQWLRPYSKATGKIFKSRQVVDLATSFAKAQGIEWPQNVLRHSYATYRLSIMPDAARVSLEMGNSPQKLFNNYRELDRENHAPAWFAIAPKRSRKVVAFTAAA
jgi:integrase